MLWPNRQASPSVMRRSPDALLVFPPFWDTASPYLSVPVLAAWMRKQGFHVETADLGLACTKALLTPDVLGRSLDAARRLQQHWPADRGNDALADFSANLSLCELVWDVLGHRLLDPFRSDAPRPQKVADYTAFRRKLAWAFAIASAPFYPLALKVEGLVGDALNRLSSICEWIDAGVQAPGMEAIEAFAREQGRRGLPLVGISVAGPSQLVPAFLMARTMKAQSPETFLVIGGPQVPYIADALRHCERVFDWVDAFVPGEGEIPLMELCAAVGKGRDATAVRGLLIRRNGRIVSTGAPERVPIEALPPPDFEGFEPDRYLGNAGCLPLTFARGCSWSQCTFCTQHICFDGYRAMAPQQVTEHLTHTVSRYGATSVAINDENLTPQRLRELAAIVRTHCPEVRWQALARLAPRLADATLARELADSGCAMLSMGLESADQAVLDRNRKGIHADKVPDVLKALHDAGIWLNIFLIFGLPGETPETAFASIDFLHANRSCVDSFSPTVFRMEKGSPIAAEPTLYGITPADVPPDHCDSELPIDHTQWLTKPEAIVCLETLIDGLVGSPQCPIEQADLNGQFVLQMLAESGIAAIRSEMQRRAQSTRAASALLEHDNTAYAPWWKALGLERFDLSDPSSRIVLSLPAQGTFFTLAHNELQLLRLRALNIPMAMLKNGFANLLSDEMDKAGVDWGITATVLLFLSSRLIQESEAGSIRVLRVVDSTPEPIATVA